MSGQKNDSLSAYIDVPYFLLDDVIESENKNYFYEDLSFIMKMYRIYKLGNDFIPEGTNGKYIPSLLKYKKAAMIINKEARFCFANTPTFNVNVDDVKGTEVEKNAIVQKFLDKVLEKNKFRNKLLKGLKDCFIGKRIAIVLNFNKDSGITITFLNPLEFYYEFSKDTDELVNFCCFYEKNRAKNLKDKRWFLKKYVKEEDGVYLSEFVYDGVGVLVETLISNEKIKFDKIPAFVVLNDGLTGEYDGVSELGNLIDYESTYSKLANADIDCERKTMNPIMYTIDASQNSTDNLSTSPGSYWDIQSDEEKATEHTAKVGILEPSMRYSEPLKTTLDRIEGEMYAEVDVPNIASDKLSGIITSGKTIGALYWGLTVRCDEKMLSWEPELSAMAEMIIEGARLYPDCISKYTTENEIPDLEYEILVENNYPLPEDIKEEKEIDMMEVEAKLRSKKSYMKRWRKITDKKAEEELLQIKLEQQMFEESMLSYDTQDVAGVEDEMQQNYTNLSRRDNPDKKNEDEEEVDIKNEKDDKNKEE